MKTFYPPLIFLILILFSCRKQEVSSSVEQLNKEKFNKFFHENTPTNSNILAVKSWLEKAIGNSSKLDLYIQRAGYPKWNHSMVIGQRGEFIQLENTNIGDSYNYVYVPFVRENEKLVNSIMVVRYNESDTSNTFLMDW